MWRGKLVRYLRLKLLVAAGVLFVGGTAALAVLALYCQHADQLVVKNARGQVIPHKILRQTSALRPVAERTYHPKNPVAPAPASTVAPVKYRIQTDEPVIFITIDDGITPDPAALNLIRQRQAAATLFLNDANISKHYDYFKAWQAAGSSIQNHTVTHPHLARLPAANQKQEICENTNRFTTAFGTKPTLMRPPFGEFNDATLQAAAECGAKYTVHWSVTVEKSQIRYLKDYTQLRPGDIVLLHFTPDLASDLATLFAAADAQQLQIGRLEDWLF